MFPINFKAFHKSAVIALFVFSSSASLGMGMSDWQAKTPCGNEINNYPGPTLHLENGKQLNKLGEWYFYKKHIVGKLGETGWIGDEGWNGDTLGYFVVSELTSRIWIFNNREEWITFLNKKNLDPFLITRWYHRDWTFFDDQIYWVLFYGFFLSIPFLFFYLFLLYKAIREEKLNLKKPHGLAASVIAGLVFIAWLWEQFPQSI